MAQGHVTLREKGLNACAYQKFNGIFKAIGLNIQKISHRVLQRFLCETVIKQEANRKS
jgi:hypothetical protein